MKCILQELLSIFLRYIITHSSFLIFVVLNFPIMKDLCHGYMLSQHNGFGPIANVPTEFFDITEDVRITKARELHYLLNSFTSVEEAAI